MSYADLLQEAAANQRALTASSRKNDVDTRDRSRQRQFERERAAEAALRDRPTASKPKESEDLTWGGLPRDHGLQKFLHLQQTRQDAVGLFARRALADESFPTDPTAIIRYLAVMRGAPGETLAAARETIREYVQWRRAGFEAALADLAFTNPERAKQVRERHFEAMKIQAALYAEQNRW